MLSVFATRARAPTASAAGFDGGSTLSAADAAGAACPGDTAAAAFSDSFATGLAPSTGLVGPAGWNWGTSERGSEISTICDDSTSAVMPIVNSITTINGRAASGPAV